MLKRQQLEEWFPDAEIWMIPAEQLPEGVRHAGARRLLSEVAEPAWTAICTDLAANAEWE